MSKKVIFIVLSVFIMIVGIFYMAISNYRSSFKSFEKSGYIIDSRSVSSGNNKSMVYYFDNNEKYKVRYDNNVIFSDVNGDKVDVLQASFIHYNDDSIGVLKKSVIFNFDEINSEIPKYYNIFEDTILEYNNGVYVVDNFGQKLNFKRFIVKIDDKKYLIVGNELKLNLDGNREITVNSNYVELNFVDEKVVTIENKAFVYQTIGKDASIQLGGDVTLNLDNRYLFYKDEAKMSIDSMIIDSSDNIEIQPIENTKEEENAEGEESNQSNANGGRENSGVNGETEDSGGAAGGIAGGIAGDGVVESELNEAELTLPTADISELDVTANKISGTIKITDKDSLISSGVTTSIIENSTGKVVDYIETDEGNYNIEIESSRLTPETTYNLVSTLSYKKNDIVYTMDIVQHVFVTSSLGINLEKDFFTSDSLNYILQFDEYSKVRSCNVSLYDTNGEVVETYPVDRSSGNEINVSFTGLGSNKKYSVVVDNILYDDYIVSDDYSIEQSAKTLKKRPDIGAPSFTLDKKNGKFTLKLDNMADSENGVDSYRYQIFDTRTMDAGNGSPVNVIEKSTLTSIDVNVDNIVYYRGVGYVFNVVIEFYDNEKYVEYITPFSEVMQLDGKEAPSISWKTNSVTFESIDGTISILDIGNTIDLDKMMTIVYTNSIGTTEQFTAVGNIVIPFTRNNLRANETYTISVYGTVDLQDGNPPIDNYHIGSASVRTMPTNPFNVSFDVDSTEVSSTFSIKTRLLNTGDADNRLEASTLTGISFVLHEGLTIEGRIVKTIPARDRDLREYFSDLQAAYYDKEFIIDPGFFGLSNSDLREEYYTIEIKDAYDYTDFKNEIGINDNIVTVKSNGYIPDIPSNPDDAVSFELVRNKDAETYDDNLNATTIVGIKVKANYDNARRYAKLIRYKVYDASDCQLDEVTETTVCRQVEIPTSLSEYQVSSDGVIDYVYIPVDYGTIYSQIDEDVRRGHNYYVTYEAMLDLNNDGIAETKYPSKKDVVLRSQNIAVPKQPAIVTMYPASSTSNTMEVKYTYTDVDYAIYDNSLHAGIGMNDYVDNTVSHRDITPTDTEQSVTFDNLSVGMLTIYSKQVLYKTGNNTGQNHDVDNYEVYPYVSQKFYGEYVLPNLTYYLETDVNRLIINFNNYTAKKDDYNRIAAINLKFKGTVNGRQKIIEKKGIKIEDGAAIVDLFDLVEFIGQDIQLSIDALYDSGLTGYSLSSSYYALQNIENQYAGGEYYRIAANGSILYDSYLPADSVFTKDTAANKYVFHSVIYDDQSMTIDHNPDEGGMVFNYSHIIPKKLNTKVLQPSTSASNSFSFNQLVPGISVLDRMGISRIVPLMTSVSVSASLYGFDSSVISVQNSKAYINIYKSDETGTEMEFITRKEININDLETGATVDGLFPDTSYAMRITAFVKDANGNYVEQTLYDVDDNTPSKVYYFNTLSGVNFSDFRYHYHAESYNSKYIRFYYSMDKTMGFDEIQYKFYKRVFNEQTGEYSYELMEDMNIPSTGGLQNNMSLKIDVNPGQTSLIFGQNYRLEVIPYVYVTIDGVRTPIQLSNEGGVYDFNLRSLKKPYVGVKGVYTSDYTGNKNVITFVTNVYDSSCVVVDDTYTIQILDENDNDITPSAYVGYNASTKRYNVEYLASDLEVGHVYRFIVHYSVDMKNNITSTEDRQYVYEINLYSSDDINVGNVVAAGNNIYPNRVDLQFSNSYRLTLIDTLSYSIYNSLDGSSIDNSIEFAPQEKTVGGQKIYVQPLPDILPTTGLYYIQTQFLYNGQVIYDGGVDYTYVG